MLEKMEAYMEAYNVKCFLSLNATANTPEWLVLIGKALAGGLIYLLPLILVVMWFWGSSSRRELALRAAFVTGVALLVSYIIGVLYPHSRPFVLGLGYAVIQHAPTPSFPSNHATIFACIGFTFLFGGKRLSGAIILILGLLVGWSRVFLGVHFPLDIVGGFCVSLLVYIGLVPAWRILGSGLLSVMQGFYRMLFAPLIRLGLIKA